MNITTLTAIAVLSLSILPIAAHADGEPGVVEGTPGSAGPSDISDEPVVTPAAPSCDFSALIGKKESEIDRAQFGDRVVRTLKPGQMVTMEYLEGRINLNVDDAGVITSVTCG